MGALPKSEPIFYADVEQVEGQQIIRLPAQLHLETTTVALTRNEDGLTVMPARRPVTEQRFQQWMRDMQAFQDELGDFFPDGRNQPPMPEPRDIFPDDPEGDQA